MTRPRRIQKARSRKAPEQGPTLLAVLLHEWGVRKTDFVDGTRMTWATAGDLLGGRRIPREDTLYRAASWLTAHRPKGAPSLLPADVARLARLRLRNIDKAAEEVADALGKG